MSLLDNIAGHGENWLEAEVIIRADSMFIGPQGVPGWIGLEYLAQTVSAFSGLMALTECGQRKPGFLLGTRKFHSPTVYFEIGDRILLRVERDPETINGLATFSCDLTCNGVKTSTTLNVYQA